MAGIRRFRYFEKDVAERITDRFGFSGDLLDIFTDPDKLRVHKWHHYIPVYDRYFAPFRGRPIKFLEIGVSDGGSLDMWRRYFGDEAVIFGVDIDERCAEFDGRSAQVRIGSQDDPTFLGRVIDEMGGVDLVLDDGSHVMEHIRASLAAIFPRLSAGGTYMIEDLHTAYWERYGGGPQEPGNVFNLMRALVDDMHHWYHREGVQAPGIGDGISGMHIHDSIVVLEKGPVFRPEHSKIGYT